MTTTDYTVRVPADPKEPPSSPLGRWVWEIRGPLSQEAFAEKVGVHWVTVNRWESRGAGMHQRSVDRILKAFPNAPRPPINGVSDPGGKVSEAPKPGGYEVQTEEGKFLARKIDAMHEDERTEALRLCLNALKELQNPHELGADTKADRSRRNK